MNHLRSKSPTIDFETDPDTISTKSLANRKISNRAGVIFVHEESAHGSASIPHNLQEYRDKTLSPPRKTKLPKPKDSKNGLPAKSSSFRSNTEGTNMREDQSENINREQENQGSYRERQTRTTNYDRRPSHAHDYRNYPTYGRGKTSCYNRSSNSYYSSRGRPGSPYNNGYTDRRDRNNWHSRNSTWKYDRRNFEQSANSEMRSKSRGMAVSTQTDFQPIPQIKTPEVFVSRPNASGRPANQNVTVSTAFATGFALAMQIAGSFQMQRQLDVSGNMFFGVSAPFIRRPAPLAIVMPGVPNSKQNITGDVSNASLLTTKQHVGNYQQSGGRKNCKTIAEEILKDLTTCKLCSPNKSFKRRRQASFHMSSVHGRRFCPVCRLTFKIKGTELKEHFLTEHTRGNRDEKAACPVCQKRYCFETMPSHLAKHLKPIVEKQIKANEKCSAEHCCNCCTQQRKFIKKENKPKIVQPEGTHCACNGAINSKNATERNEQPMDSFEELD